MIYTYKLCQLGLGLGLKLDPKFTPLICDKCIILTSGILLVDVDKRLIAFCRLFWVFFLETIERKQEGFSICLCRGLNLKCVNGLIENLRK